MQEKDLDKLEALLREEFLASKPFETSGEKAIISIDITEIMKKATSILKNGGFYIYKENANDLTLKKLENHKICMLVASFDILKGASLEGLANNKAKVLEDAIDDDTSVIFSVKESDKENVKLLCFYQEL
ncbi:hypothetical protein [Helicobacter burdigaliensis]|uniref:hypothetical protein n=1 Tax=Helicobacter burdigaliensis TaxID=2315334 RepID=UPI000EF70389|nr:hypothetical protein [Helicobacter burdigaliensis]